MTDTAAHIIVATLENAGAKRIYGVVGDSLNSFTPMRCVSGAKSNGCIFGMRRQRHSLRASRSGVARATSEGPVGFK
jgi:hypothetical protein